MKKLFTFSLLLFTSAADACTGMYAGKKVMTDGSVLIGWTVEGQVIAPL